MEISKSLQEEILAVQNKLKNAIRDHQICVGKLKDDPNNTDILGQIQKIHFHIVSLGRCQKQVVQRLRKEVEAFKAENANGAKVSIASLLGLNNNNHITNNNERKVKTGTNDFIKKPSKEDYEDIVRNGDVPSLGKKPAPAKERASSVETISGEDDVIEVSMDENSNEKTEKQEQQPEKERKVESTEKLNFLCALGLITTLTCSELQNRRAERKRRSTANPQFVYSSLEVPTKRKRHSYLQSSYLPLTRQTAASLNGPSPPPAKVVSTKSTSPPSKTVMKSFIPVQKSTTRPNILRNVTESKVYINKTKVENGPNQIHLPVPTVKTVQSIGSKAVHIPGLPSSLTIERIGNDSAVCITCRNPGTLTVCENCASKYHVSCHSISPAPARICPKCAFLQEEEEEEIEEGEDGEAEQEEGCPSFKKDEEFATTSHASGINRKAREDSEIYKATCGLHKTDATPKKRGFSSAIGIGQLPSSTFLIPISSNNVSSSTVNQSEVGSSATISVEQRESSVPYSPVILNQLPRSSVAYVQAEPQVSYAYQLPVSSVQPEKHQSYLIVKKITEPSRRGSQSSEDQGHASLYNYQLPTTSGYNSRVQTEVSVAHSPVFFGKQMPDTVSRSRKKQTNRAVPALNRIVDTENISVTAEYQLGRSTLNGRKSKASRQSRNKFGINQTRSARATEILLPSYDSAESDKQLQIAKSTEPEEAAGIFSGRAKYRPRTGGLLHSLFSGHNKSYIVTDHSRESREFGASDKDHTTIRQQLYNQDYQLESSESNEPPAQLQRGALTKFFEHVKLEEAHIPAPLRAKLVYKGGTVSERNELGVSEAADESKRSDECATITKTSLPSTNFEGHFAKREGKRNSWLSNRHGMKKCQKSDATNNMESLDSVSSLMTRTDDYVTYDRKHDNAYVRIDCDLDENEGNTLASVLQSDLAFSRRIVPRLEIVPESRRDREGMVSLRNAQTNLLELRNEVSVPDDKADTERQDLSSGRRSTSSSSSTSSSTSTTSDSDTPEQAMNDSIKRSRRRLSGNEYEKRLGINAVSPESMQVLEQFESAMLETDCSNAATC